MFTNKRFTPPRTTNPDVAALGKALADYLLSLEGAQSLTLSSATGLNGTPVGDKDASTGKFTTLEVTNSSIFPTTTWTPTLSFQTPGNLAITYSAQLGRQTKIGNLVYLEYRINTSAFSFSTASGVAKITGFPVVPGGTPGSVYVGELSVQGVTKAGYTSFCSEIDQGDATIYLLASGSGVALDNVTAANMPTGGSVILWGSILYVSV